MITIIIIIILMKAQFENYLIKLYILYHFLILFDLHLCIYSPFNSIFFSATRASPAIKHLLSYK